MPESRGLNLGINKFMAKSDEEINIEGDTMASDSDKFLFRKFFNP